MGKQKRSEGTYTKINTVFKRDKHNCIMPYDGYVMEELEWMKDCLFDADEKIDGTNIRIEVTRDISVQRNGDGNLYEYRLNWNVDYKGKTDNAQIQPRLLAFLRTTYPADKVLGALGLKTGLFIGTSQCENEDDARECMLVPSAGEALEEMQSHKWVTITSKGELTDLVDFNRIPKIYTLYGEGYGIDIQKGGYYRKDDSFIGFDVRVDDTYLLRASRNEIFEKLGCPIVPYMGQFTIAQAIEFVKKGFKSKIAEEDHLAEGLVLRTPMELLNRRGERVMFKVKTCDWDKYFAMYHTYDKVEQEPHLVS